MKTGYASKYESYIVIVRIVHRHAVMSMLRYIQTV